MKLIRAIEYTGKVTVSLKYKAKVISKNTYYNNGCNDFFNFLASCVAGNYTSAERNRPTKIMLFYNKSSSVPKAAEDLKLSNLFGNNTSSVTAFITSQAAGIINTNGNTGADRNSEEDFCRVNLQFTIPASSLAANNTASGGSTSQICINQMALYKTSAANTTADIQQPLAYFLMTDETGTA